MKLQQKKEKNKKLKYIELGKKRGQGSIFESKAESVQEGTQTDMTGSEKIKRPTHSTPALTILETKHILTRVSVIPS